MQATKLDQGAVYAQVGYGNTDHNYWGRPEDWPADLQRPSYKLTAAQPGSDLAGNYASTLALTSLAFAETDPAYAATLVTVARQLYDFANKNRGIYSDSVSDPEKPYALVKGKPNHRRII